MPDINAARRRFLKLTMLGMAGCVLASCKSEGQLESELRNRFIQNFHKFPRFQPDKQVAALHSPSYSGVALVVNVWASWCAPCVHEMPSLQKLGTFFKSEDLQIIGINVDKDINLMREFLRRNQLNFPVVLDPANETLRVPTLPSTFLLRRDHTIAQVFVGDRDWSDHGVIGEIERLLAIKRQTPPKLPDNSPKVDGLS
ncbi:MAG: TlpA disulfide reductase family protein [Candidatus Nitrotoga sp.]